MRLFQQYYSRVGDANILISIARENIDLLPPTITLKLRQINLSSNCQNNISIEKW